MATSDGTWKYRDRFGPRYGRTYFRRCPQGVVSSLGVGTYRGDPGDSTDADYERLLTTAVESGINHLDTAVNYRCQRSERVLGRALAAADIDRSEVVVATKGGFLPFDREPPDDPSRYIRDTYLSAGLVAPSELARGSHCLSPEFIDAMVDRSLENLDLERIDCYYLHNPETQLAERPKESVYDLVESAFAVLEERRAAGDIDVYGVATWEALRVPPNHESHLGLGELLTRAQSAAQAVGVDSHGFRMVQLPFNIEMADAFTVEAHYPPEDDADRVSALDFAHGTGLSVVASAGLSGGALTRSIPADLKPVLAGDTAAQRALNFARSAPAVTTTLFGTTRVSHLRENIAAGTFDPMGASAFDKVFE